MHPSDQGATAQQLGVSQATFDMNNRLFETGSCRTTGNSAMVFSRYSGDHLPLTAYLDRLRGPILGDACHAFSDTGAIIDVAWRDGGDLWDLEPSARDSDPVKALSVEDRQRLVQGIAALVGGSTVKRTC
jgi:hypothetical protein